MNRRQLLKALIAGGAVTAAGLWAPTRSIFLPPRGGWPAAEGGYLVPPELSGQLHRELLICSGTVLLQPGDYLEVGDGMTRRVVSITLTEKEQQVLIEALTREDFTRVFASVCKRPLAKI